MINTSSGLPGIVQSIVGIFNAILPVLTALAVVLFFIGVVKYIRHEGEAEKGKIILWSMVALFVLLSLWGILRIMCGTLTGSGSCSSAQGGGSATGGLPSSFGGTATNLW